MNHHYRRLNGAKSNLQLDKIPACVNKRLSKSSSDIAFSRNRANAKDFSLDCISSSTARSKKHTISDDALDVMSRHSAYFTRPDKAFTPRIVQKIVRPNILSHFPMKLRPSSNSSSRSSHASKPFKSADPAFSNPHDRNYPNTRNSSNPTDFPSSDFKLWLRQQ